MIAKLSLWDQVIISEGVPFVMPGCRGDTRVVRTQHKWDALLNAMDLCNLPDPSLMCPDLPDPSPMFPKIACALPEAPKPSQDHSGTTKSRGVNDAHDVEAFPNRRADAAASLPCPRYRQTSS